MACRSIKKLTPFSSFHLYSAIFNWIPNHLHLAMFIRVYNMLPIHIYCHCYKTMGIKNRTKKLVEKYNWITESMLLVNNNIWLTNSNWLLDISWLLSNEAWKLVSCGLPNMPSSFSGCYHRAKRLGRVFSLTDHSYPLIIPCEANPILLHEDFLFRNPQW